MIDGFMDILSKGGPAAVIVAVGYTIKLLADARRESRAGNGELASSGTSDLATANAILRDQLKGEREENTRLRQENDTVRQERDDLADELIGTKKDYEEQLDVLRRRIGEITRQLDSLQARLQSEPPTTH